MRTNKILSYILLIIGGISSILGVCLFVISGEFSFVFGKWAISTININQYLSILFTILLFVAVSIHVFKPDFRKYWYVNLINSALIFGSIINSIIFVVTINSEELDILFSLLYNYAFIGISVVSLLICGIILLTLNKEIIISKKTSKKPVLKIYETENTQEPEISKAPEIAKEPAIDPNFTSTPNEETFNISDKLEQLKNNLNNNVFNDQHMESVIKEHEEKEILKQENTQENENIDFLDENQAFVAPQEFESNQEIFNEIEEPKEDKFANAAIPNNLPKEEELPPILEPIDPYKQTIVPRRSLNRASKFEKPIGNVPSNGNSLNSNNRKTPKYDSNYEGKVFLGDSDKIWEAMKKQERNLINKNTIPEKVVNKTNIVDNLQKEKTKTMEVDLNKILDPVNDKKPDFTPTIDWDD